ncbi:hypothetical protein KKG45_02910 [bacterium]|nr:hypothetical protein [bacterium]MBU1072174.1 hypothetical protein [bacterium]MBU1675569.1 hypothetical protein [bacterium]
MIAAIAISTDLTVWVSALLTLMVFSFLYRDNPFYKVAEHIFVGVSAAYWMVIGFWTTFWPQVVVKLVPAASRVTSPEAVPGGTDLTALAPLALGLLMLCRLVPSWAWLGRWPTAFVIGTTAGYGLVRYIRSDFVYQIRATVGRGLLPMVDGRWLWQESLAALVILIGTLSGLVYFINTREHRGAYGRVARLGLMFMLVTFGASFGSAVMARFALLIGRFQELLGEWLGLIS